jgi:hypothetical protein
VRVCVCVRALVCVRVLALRAGIFSGPAVASVEGLTPSEMDGVFNWLEFYKKEYTVVGVVEGLYFDASGAATPATRDVEAMWHTVAAAKEEQAALTTLFPPCDMTFTMGVGGRVWCATNSGGIKRDWVGVPRLFFTPFSSEPRCVCVHNDRIGDGRLKVCGCVRGCGCG